MYKNCKNKHCINKVKQCYYIEIFSNYYFFFRVEFVLNVFILVFYLKFFYFI